MKTEEIVDELIEHYSRKSVKERLAELTITDTDGCELSIASDSAAIPDKFKCTVGITTPPGGRFIHHYEDGGVTVVFGFKDRDEIIKAMTILFQVVTSLQFEKV